MVRKQINWYSKDYSPTFRVTATRDLQEKGTLAKINISVINLRYHNDICHMMKGKTYQEEIDYIVTNEKRNKFITNLALDQNGNSLVLFQFVEKHGKVLYDMMKQKLEMTARYFTYQVKSMLKIENRYVVSWRVKKMLSLLPVLELFLLGLTFVICLILFSLVRLNRKLRFYNLSEEGYEQVTMGLLLTCMIFQMTSILKVIETLL